MAKTTKVQLTASERVEMFEIEHATRILRMGNNGGWTLTDTQYTFDGKTISKRKR